MTYSELREQADRLRYPYRWTITGPAGIKVRPSGQKVAMVKAQCQCGTVAVVEPHTIRRGLSKSCGCLRDELHMARLATL